MQENERTISKRNSTTLLLTMTKKIILVCTSASDLKGHKTGLWIEECATPYFLFLEKGYEVTIASPKGGPIPIDAASLADGMFTYASKKFMHSAECIDKLSHSVALKNVDLEGIDALYMAGGHGTAVDFFQNPILINMIESTYAAGKVVAADCHGPICLADCNKPDGTPLVKGLVVTGFSDSEEDAVQLSSIVPFLIETRFKELGAKYEKGDDWTSKVCVDKNLITGQNPQSSDECAQAVIAALEK
jgi:putative intracellular protease/amidase